MIDSQDYDRTVKISANMTVLVQKMVTIFWHDAFTKLSLSCKALIRLISSCSTCLLTSLKLSYS